MRNLISLIDVLSESVGLANRRAGEKFANKSGDTITFQSLDFFPASGRYDTAAELDRALNDTVSPLGLDQDQLTWVNKRTAKTGAFALAKWTAENGNPWIIGRWFNEISPNRAQNHWPNSDVPGGFSLQSRSAQKENFGYKPSEILTQFKNNTPETVLSQVRAKFGADSDLAKATEIFIQSNLPCSIPRGNINPEAFRDYFCELLQPIALVMNKKVSGNAQEAADIFLGETYGYQDCSISFNNNTTGGLYDSLLVSPNGQQIKLSSKGKDGASASVTNLRRSVQELEKAPQGRELLNKYQDTIAILDIIERDGHFGAPLTLAKKFGMITDQEAQQVSTLRRKGPQDLILGQDILSSNLETLYKERKVRDASRIVPIEHLTAAIAYKVADYVNNKTNFGRAASAILNNAALVQMYTNMSVSATTITIELNAQYPSEAVTGVLLDASKVYFSTGGKGNFTFTILKNGATAQDVSDADGIDTIEQPGPGSQTDEPQFKRSDIAAVDTTTTAPVSDRELYGRRRRSTS